MNRKTFLASIVGLITIPFIGKSEKKRITEFKKRGIVSHNEAIKILYDQRTKPRQITFNTSDNVGLEWNIEKMRYDLKKSIERTNAEILKRLE